MTENLPLEVGECTELNTSLCFYIKNDEHNLTFLGGLGDGGELQFLWQIDGDCFGRMGK